MMSLAIDILSWLCLLAGSAFCLIGAIGTLRLPDLYSRTHAATITDTMGAGLVLLGLVLQAGPTLIALKLFLVLLFLLYTSPVGGHALVKAAYAHGLLAPLDKPDGTSPDAPVCSADPDAPGTDTSAEDAR